MSSSTIVSVQSTVKNSEEPVTVETTQIQDLNSSWPVVAGSFIIHFVVIGQLYAYGIFNAFYVSQKISNSNSHISLIGSLSIGLLSGSGIGIGKLVNNIGYRKTVIVGGIVVGLSFMLASFYTEVWFLILTQGIGVGIGSGMAFFPSVSAPSFWYLKKRGLVIGISVSGAGIGGFFYSLVLEKLLSLIGLQWTLRIVGIFEFVSILSCSLLIKVPKSNKKPKQPFSYLSALKNPKFLFLYSMIVIGGFGYLIPLVYIPTYAQFYLNVSKSHGALAISLFNFASTIGRILAGIFADKFFGRFNSFMGSFILSGISIIVLWGNSTSFAILIAFSITFGIIVGGVISLLPVVVADLFGLDVLANMMGICFSGYFFGNVLGPPIGGYFLDKFQNNGAINWLPTIALSASLMMLAGVMGIGIKIIEKKKKLNNL